MNKILVIDSDENFRATLVETLAQQGFEVLQAAAGARGVQMARTEAPELILCDVELQGVGGNLVLYAVRRDPMIGSIPFVLMSGFAFMETAPQGGLKGADGFLAKPFSPTKLAATIGECLGRERKPVDQAGNDSSAARAEGRGASLGGLLHPLKQILEATGLITTACSRLDLKEIVGLASQAHQAASHVYQRIETWLPAPEIGS